MSGAPKGHLGSEPSPAAAVPAAAPAAAPEISTRVLVHALVRDDGTVDTGRLYSVAGALGMSDQQLFGLFIGMGIIMDLAGDDERRGAESSTPTLPQSEAPAKDRDVGPPPAVAVDAPEKGACFSRATARLKELLSPGSAVRIERDTALKDPYDRYLLYTWNEDGVFVNEARVRSGHAKGALHPPNDARWPQIPRAHDAARQARRPAPQQCPSPPTRPSPLIRVSPPGCHRDCDAGRWPAAAMVGRSPRR